jgi:hypothetical protein
VYLNRLLLIKVEIFQDETEYQRKVAEERRKNKKRLREKRRREGQKKEGNAMYLNRRRCNRKDFFITFVHIAYICFIINNYLYICTCLRNCVIYCQMKLL